MGYMPFFKSTMIIWSKFLFINHYFTHNFLLHQKLLSIQHKNLFSTKTEIFGDIMDGPSDSIFVKSLAIHISSA